MRDYYKVLGVPRTAIEDEIKHAYRKLMKDVHPDFHPDDKDLEERSKEINEAYATLGDKDKKREYDFKLNQNIGQTTTAFDGKVNFETSSKSPFGYGFNIDNLFAPFVQKTNPNYNPTAEFDRFIKELEELEKEANKYGMSTEKYRENIQNRRGTMTVNEMREAKSKVKSEIEHRKAQAKRFDDFNAEYKRLKEELENQGEILEGDFSKYLDSKNKYKIEEKELKDATLEMRNKYYEAKRRINARINEIVSAFEKYGFSAIMLLNSRNISLRQISNEKMEELEEIIKLIREIDKKMKPLKSTVNELLLKLRINYKKMSIPMLKFINKKIDEELIKGMFAKHRIMNMNITLPEEPNEEQTPKI